MLLPRLKPGLYGQIHCTISLQATICDPISSLVLTEIAMLGEKEIRVTAQIVNINQSIIIACYY